MISPQRVPLLVQVIDIPAKLSYQATLSYFFSIIRALLFPENDE